MSKIKEGDHEARIDALEGALVHTIATNAKLISLLASTIVASKIPANEARSLFARIEAAQAELRTSVERLQEGQE